MLIVTGLGRCGTSLVMRILKDLDFNLGVNVDWYDEINAGLELGSVHRITSEMYFRFLKKGMEINLDEKSEFNHWKDYTFRYILNNFDRDNRQKDFVDVIKDPRLTWHPDLIKVFWECRKDIKLLICHRDPSKIFSSRIKMGKDFEDPKDERMKDVNVFKIDFCDFLTEVMKLEIQYELIYFPNFLKEPEILYKSLSNLCPNFKIIKDDFFKSFNKIVNLDLHHES